VNPLAMRMMFNLYPPYLGTGISVRSISPDFRRIVVDMRLRFYNRNYVGTHFGGSLSAMTDPFYMLMVMKNLGGDYIVWDKHGTIDYRKPGRGRVRAEFTIDGDFLDACRQETAAGRKYEPTLSVDIMDESGDIVSHVTRTLYIRRKRRKTGESA
jgi:acyl-coenzyme A thioesterase PaaI-like protein